MSSQQQHLLQAVSQINRQNMAFHPNPEQPAAE
jgi:hypothetical protein